MYIWVSSLSDTFSTSTKSSHSQSQVWKYGRYLIDVKIFIGVLPCIPAVKELCRLWSVNESQEKNEKEEKGINIAFSQGNYVFQGL